MNPIYWDYENKLRTYNEIINLQKFNPRQKETLFLK